MWIDVVGYVMKELPEEIGRDVVMLKCPSSAERGECHVYLIGTTHISMVIDSFVIWVFIRIVNLDLNAVINEFQLWSYLCVSISTCYVDDVELLYLMFNSLVEFFDLYLNYVVIWTSC